MKRKALNLVIFFAVLFLMTSCGGLSPKDYKEMPAGADFEKVYNALINIMKENPSFYEIKGTFNIESKNMTPPTLFSVTYIPTSNKETFYEYHFNMVDARWSGPTQVTLHDRGNEEEKLDKEALSDILFTREEMPDFSQFDGLYIKAIEAASLGEGSCVIAFNMDKLDGNTNFYITVSTKDAKTKKAVYFDKSGNVLKTIDTL